MLLMDHTRTLLDVLADHAAERPEKTAFTFHKNTSRTYGELWENINQFAGFLINQGLKPRDRVLIVLPNCRCFFTAFYGTQRAGGIAVPIYPGSGIERIVRLAKLCEASTIIISKNFSQARLVELEAGAKNIGVSVCFVEESSFSGEQKLFPKVSPEDVSYIQFTSGSTGNPKGVQLTHVNLMTNIKQMIEGMDISKTDIFVNWLPVYHDMGLILMTMVPFYLGLDLVILPTGILHIRNWLKSIQNFQATFTAAPDFAYRLCLLYIKNPSNYDLSSLRIALNAAEPVRSSTIARFEKKFRLKNVMLPAYGLAEASVGVCCWKPGQKIKVDSRGFVSVGSPFPNIRIEIMNNHKRAKTGEIGEIWVQSKSNTLGYYKNPKATRELFGGGNFIRTGDLGYVDTEGDYYIVGRKKNIIKQAGVNIAAGEVEELLDPLSFVRRTAALGIDRDRSQGEHVYIFLEVNLKRSLWQQQEILKDMTIEVVQRFKDTFGVTPGRVYLLKSHSIPMTYNGKIKHQELKDLYLAGTLRTRNLMLFPEY